MAKRTIKLYYCNSCPKWCGNQEECPTCGSVTTQRELPNKRAGLYYVDACDSPLTSVTKILGDVINKPQLTYWLKQKVAEAVFADPTISLAEAIAAPDRVKNAAASKGSDIHRIIESGATGEYTSPWLEYVNAYKKFCADVPHKIIESEKTVYHARLGYAGTLDAIIELESGERVLVDYKTSKNVYPKDYSLQLSAYKLALHETGVDIGRLMVLHLKPDSTYSFIELPFEPGAWESVLHLYNYFNN